MMRITALHIALGLAVASTVAASPAAIEPRVARPLNELTVRDPTGPVQTQDLEKRTSAQFNLEHTWNKEVLFGGSFVNNQTTNAESVALNIVCLDCWTKGTVAASLKTEDIIDPVLRLDFSGVEAYVDLGISASAGATYAINLFGTDTPCGLGLPGLNLGLDFYLDLVFSLSATVDFTGGFYVKVADGAYLEADIFGGKIVDHFFDGLSSKSIPVEVTAGSATFRADLRLRVQCGAEADLDIIGIGAGADVGIYANLLEFVAVLESTPTCDVQTLEYWDLNVGAYAQLDVEVDHKTIGAVPSISTTLLNSPTFTQCWKAHSPGETGGVSTTTATTVGVPAYSQTIASTGSAGSGSGSVVVPTSSPGNSGATSPSGTASAEGSLATSTVYSTTVYTVTSCAATVVNCPASLQSPITVTQTVGAFSTVSPVTADVTYPTATTTSVLSSSVPAVDFATTEVVVLVPCATPIENTFGVPSASPSVAVPAPEHAVTAVLTTPTTLSLTVASHYPYSNATESYISASKVSAGFGSSTAKPTAYTAGAGPAKTSKLTALLAVAGALVGGMAML